MSTCSVTFPFLTETENRNYSAITGGFPTLFLRPYIIVIIKTIQLHNPKQPRMSVEGRLKAEIVKRQSQKNVAPVQIAVFNAKRALHFLGD